MEQNFFGNMDVEDDSNSDSGDHGDGSSVDSSDDDEKILYLDRSKLKTVVPSIPNSITEAISHFTKTEKNNLVGNKLVTETIQAMCEKNLFLEMDTYGMKSTGSGDHVIINRPPIDNCRIYAHKSTLQSLLTSNGDNNHPVGNKGPPLLILTGMNSSADDLLMNNVDNNFIKVTNYFITKSDNDVTAEFIQNLLLNNTSSSVNNIEILSSNGSINNNNNNNEQQQQQRCVPPQTFDFTKYKTVGSITKLFEQGDDDYLPAMLWTSESRIKNGWQKPQNNNFNNFTKDYIYCKLKKSELTDDRQECPKSIARSEVTQLKPKDSLGKNTYSTLFDWAIQLIDK